MKPSWLGQAPAAALTATFQRRNPVKWVHLGRVSGLSASSCVAGLQHSELFRGRSSPAPGSPRQLPPSAESIHSVCGFIAHLLLFPFFPSTKASSWGSAGAPIWMEEVLKDDNKYYNLFAVGITCNVLCAFRRQLEGEWFWLCVENLYKYCIICKRILFFLDLQVLNFCLPRFMTHCIYCKF